MTTTTTLSDELVHLIQQMYAAFTSGDPAAWSGHVAQTHDVVGIGTDPTEFWIGRDRVTDVTNTQLQEMSAAGISFSAGHIRAGSAGDVAWGVDEPTLHMPDGPEQPMRLTVVAVKEHGELRWTHFHLSVGVANAEALELDLTT